MMFDSGVLAELGERCGDALEGFMVSNPGEKSVLIAAGHEADLVAVARHRDREAFRRLFDHFAPRLRSFLRRLRTPEATIDDLVQDVMASVWRRANSYDPARASASTWIFTIARNRRIDLARRKRPEVDLDDLATVHEEADGEPLPDAQASHSQMATILRQVMSELPADQSEIVALAYHQDMSHSEIAAQLDLPLGTVKSRLRLALVKLRTAMEGLD
jgi:RNA polymerase sigma factor (sigma-70 family)